MMPRLIFGAFVFVSFFAAVASAHHSHAMYDYDGRITVTGTASEVHWRNPHVWLYVTATGENGESQNWVFEGGAPAELVRQGWNGENPKPGDPVTVLALPLKDGARGGLLRRVTFADGSEFTYNSPVTGPFEP
jgi:hypothetical protein